MLGEAGYLGGGERLGRIAAEFAVPSHRAARLRTAARAAAAAAGELAPSNRMRRPPGISPSCTAFLARHERLPLESLGRAHQRFDDRPRPFGDVAAMVRRWIEGQTFMPRAGSSGVQLLDGRTARYGDFDQVHLVGLVEGEWPQPAAANIFYPSFLLKTLGWPEPRARLGAERAAFHDLLALPRERIAVSTFRLEHDAIVGPSVLLEDLDRAGLEVIRVPATTGGRIFLREALAGTPPVPEAVTGDAADWLALRRARRDAGDPVFHGTAGPHRPALFSVSGLERYGDCPFRFFAEQVLELHEEPEDEPGRSPRARGKFVHRVFQAFFETWSRRGRHAITPDSLDEARAVFAESVEPLLAELPAAEAAIERAVLFGLASAEGMAESVFRVEAERPAPVVERLLEYGLKGEFEIAGSEETRRVALRGVADRIDLLEGGAFRLIDYKLGGAPPADRALQLPIYAVCAGSSWVPPGAGPGSWPRPATSPSATRGGSCPWRRAPPSVRP